jgi:hypothetical protein
LKAERGCEEDSPIEGVWKLKDWEFRRCPRKLVTRASIEYLNAYLFFEKGYLPNPGGWLDQPLKFIQAIKIIEREIALAKEKED